MFQKGYKVLDLYTGEIFVTRHIKFNEHIFPFVSKTAVESPVTAKETVNHGQFYDISPASIIIESRR